MSMWGQNKFGGGNTFGQPAGGAFGQAAGGGFGAAGGVFGAAKPTFGQPGAFGQPAGGAFGGAASGMFGQPAAAGFGQPAASGVFGAGGFGASTGGAFGAAGAFGKPAFGAAAGGGFGTATTGAFGAATGTGLGGGGAFGAQAPCPGSQKGQFQPAAVPRQAQGSTPAGQDYYQSIVAAVQQKYSQEELRMADYQQQKHKGGAGGFAVPAPAFGGGGTAFGASTGGAFGAPATGFGANGGFGAPASSAATAAFGGFGAGSSSAFGAKPTFGGFGAAAGAATGGFGAGFGAPTSTGSTFGAAPTGGFGGFGAATGATFGGFGASKPASTGGFGGFGTTTAGFQGFGAGTAAPSGGGFGGFGGFGAATGATSSGFGGFGAASSATATGGFGGFGAKSTSGGFGGFGAATGAAGGFGGFGAATGAAGGFGFGAKSTSGGFAGFGGATSSGFGGGFGGFGAKPATSSFGSSFGTAATGGGFATGGFGGFGTSAFGAAAQQPFGAATNVGLGMVNPAAQMQMQVAYFGGMHAETNPLGPSPFDKTEPSPSADPKRSPKTLTVFPDTKRSTDFVNTQARVGTRRGPNGSAPMRPRTSRLASPAQEAISSPGRTPRRSSGLSDSRIPADESFGEGALSISASWAADPRLLTMDAPTPIDTRVASGNVVVEEEEQQEEEDDGYSFEKHKMSPPPVKQSDPEAQIPVRAPYEPSKLNDKWKKQADRHDDFFPRLPSDCFCKPSIEELRSKPEDHRRRIVDFTICKEGFGAIRFEGVTDTTCLDLTTSNPAEGLVTWEGRRNYCTGVTLYPEELLVRLGRTKPAQGEELNKPAEITLNFQPKWKVEDIRSGIENGDENDGDKMKFISYDPDSGELKFRVKHFTRWGLSAAVIDEATPRGRAGVDEFSMDDSDAENMPIESFLKIGGHSSIRITPSSEQRRFAKPAVARTPDSDSMNEDDASDSNSVFGDDTVRKALEALGSNRDAYRQDDCAVDSQRSFFKGMGSYTESSMVDGGATPGTVPELQSGAVAVAPHRFQEAFPIEDFPTTATDPIRMPTRDPREELDLPHESHEFRTGSSWNDGVVLNREDYGARMGRSFRVGWGPGGMLIYNFIGPNSAGRTTTMPIGTLRIQTVTASSLTGDSTSDEAINRDLSTRLAHHKSEARTEENEEATAVEKLLEQYSNTCDSDVEKQVWQLVRCLYLGDASKDVRHAVSTWLQQSTALSSDPTLVRIRGNPTLVELLSCRHIEKACEAAVKKRDFRLAALIAQADGPSDLRAQISKQVKCWKRGPVHVWKQMKAPERHVYAILSGEFDTTEEDLGISPETLGWRSCLGLHMWYKFGGGFQSGSSLEQLRTVLDSYEASWQANKAPRPRPPYARRSCPQDQSHDVCYSLLQCYAQTPVALDPRAHRPAVLDCSFVWHLQSLLAEIPAADGSVRPALPPQKLNNEFIFQLEARGLLRWAIYVATQCQPQSAAAALASLEQTPFALDLLCRYAPRLSDADFLWLRDKVGLPLGWLTYARAVTAASVGDAVEESIRLAETLGEMGGAANRRILLTFAKQMKLTLAAEVTLLVDLDRDVAGTRVSSSGIAAAAPFAEPLCRWARQRLRAVALSRLAPCFAAVPRRRSGGENDLGGMLARLLQLLDTPSTQAVALSSAVGASACTACALEGAYLASQKLREKTAAAEAARKDGHRSPTRPRLSDTDSAGGSTEAAMDEDMDGSDDLWLIANNGLQTLIRSHRLPLPGSSTIAAYQLALAGELSAALSREAITKNDLGRLAETKAALRELEVRGWLLERSLLTAVVHQLRWAEP